MPDVDVSAPAPTTAAPTTNGGGSLRDPLSDALADPLGGRAGVPEAPPGRPGNDPLSTPDAAFRHAMSGPKAELPFRERLEASLGKLPRLQVVLGGPQAGAGLGALGAKAAAFGTSVAFRNTNPSLELVAHEVAHVVQQQGAQGAATGVSQPGDQAERSADAAAAAVMQGQVIDVPGVPGLTIHRHVDTAGGRFEVPEYAPKQPPAFGALITVGFTPNDTVESNHIALIQTVHSMESSAGETPHPSLRTTGQGATSDAALTVMDPASPGYGTRIDAPSGQNTPVYGGGRRSRGLADLGRDADGRRIEPMQEFHDDGSSGPADLHEGTTSDTGGSSQEGFRRQRGGAWQVQQATMTDAPGGRVPDDGTYSGTVRDVSFEIAALAIDGAQPNRWLGSIRWGYHTDARGRSSLNPQQVQLQSRGDPSDAFVAAAEQWNGARVEGQRTVDLPLPRSGGRSSGGGGSGGSGRRSR